MDELSNDCDLENEDFDEDEDEDEYESNSINGRVANHEEANFTRSHKRKISTDSSKYCKKRKCRTTFSKSQLNTLETEFLNSNFVSNDRIDLIIELTGLDSRIIKVRKQFTFIKIKIICMRKLVYKTSTLQQKTLII